MEPFITLRDYLRYAVTSFAKAGVVHGHGTTSAVDEAAFIILESLKLPVGDINPWLDARLLPDEAAAISTLIAQRVTTRKPAAYLLNKIYMQGVGFYIDERAIIPRSYVGELLAAGVFDNQALELDPRQVKTVLDLCTGSGCLAILAAQHFSGAEVHATDISADALEVAKINVDQHHLKDRVTLHHGDLFAPVGNQRFDLIIANPPYVAEGEVEVFPPEYAHEPALAHRGGVDGFDLVRKIIKEAPHHLNPGGGLLCEIGTGAEILEAEFSDLNFFWLDAEEAESEVFFLKY